MNDRSCDVCGLPFTDAEWQDRHSPHEEGCGFDTKGSCFCDSEVHAACCPDEH